MFKEYQDSRPENKVSVSFPTFHNTVKLLEIRGDSKDGFSTYYIKFRHSKNVFDHMLDGIEKMDLNGRYSIDIFGLRKIMNK